MTSGFITGKRFDPEAAIFEISKHATGTRQLKRVDKVRS